MSVTFLCPEEEDILRKCKCPCLSWNNGVSDPYCDCDCDNGIYTVLERHHEMNLSNMNARELLFFLQLPDMLMGELGKDQLPKLMQRILLVENTELWRGMISDRQVLSPRLVVGGRSEEQVLSYLTRMKALGKVAQELGGGIVWG